MHLLDHDTNRKSELQKEMDGMDAEGSSDKVMLGSEETKKRNRKGVESQCKIQYAEMKGEGDKKIEKKLRKKKEKAKGAIIVVMKPSNCIGMYMYSIEHIAM